MLKKFITTILIALTSVASSFGQNDEFPDSCSVSLITCYPGPVVFELYGHTALRVRNADYDLAYNFASLSKNSTSRANKPSTCGKSFAYSACPKTESIATTTSTTTARPVRAT